MPLTYFQPSQVDNSFNGYLRNRIINGAMMIDQRNAGAAVTINSAANTYTIDRFLAGGQATDGVFTVQRSTVVPPGFTNSVAITVTTADASIGATQAYYFRQNIEGFNVADLGFGNAWASTVTLSFWVRSSVTGTFGGALNNSAFNRSYPFSYSINSANAWEYKTVTIAGDTSGTWLTDNGIGLAVTWSLGMGSTYSGTANAWAGTLYLSPTGATNLIATNGATLYITGVQLEDGAVATPFERRMYPQELAMCQRYYAKTYNTETTPGTATTTGYIITTTNASGWAYVTWNFAVAMRASPTITAYNHSTGATGTWQDGGGTARAVTVVGAGSSNVSFGSTASNLNSWLAGHAIASAEL
jgi:hypothetical protein